MYKEWCEPFIYVNFRGCPISYHCIIDAMQDPNFPEKLELKFNFSGPLRIIIRGDKRLANIVLLKHWVGTPSLVRVSVFDVFKSLFPDLKIKKINLNYSIAETIDKTYTLENEDGSTSLEMLIVDGFHHQRVAQETRVEDLKSHLSEWFKLLERYYNILPDKKIDVTVEDVTTDWWSEEFDNMLKEHIAKLEEKERITKEELDEINDKLETKEE